MLLLSYIRWAKDPTRPPTEIKVPKFILDATLLLHIYQAALISAICISKNISKKKLSSDY